MLNSWFGSKSKRKSSVKKRTKPKSRPKKSAPTQNKVTIVNGKPRVVKPNETGKGFHYKKRLPSGNYRKITVPTNKTMTKTQAQKAMRKKSSTRRR